MTETEDRVSSLILGPDPDDYRSFRLTPLHPPLARGDMRGVYLTIGERIRSNTLSSAGNTNFMNSLGKRDLGFFV